MKKKFFKLTLAAAFAVAVGYGVYANQVENETMTDIMLENVEALASGESGQRLDCWETVSSTGNILSTHVTYCGNCQAVLAKSWSRKSICN